MRANSAAPSNSPRCRKLKKAAPQTGEKIIRELGAISGTDLPSANSSLPLSFTFKINATQNPGCNGVFNLNSALNIALPVKFAVLGCERGADDAFQTWAYLAKLRGL
ncbi:hypothetical protein HMPREF0577_1023 [Mobiluncus mulieris ATCC 35243]|nr:hypothetical protein HMPREF0577_1023 [Mobiluncus mulieris ATCC 35243]